MIYDPLVGYENKPRAFTLLFLRVRKLSQAHLGAAAEIHLTTSEIYGSWGKEEYSGEMKMYTLLRIPRWPLLRPTASLFRRTGWERGKTAILRRTVAFKIKCRLELVMPFPLG